MKKISWGIIGCGNVAEVKSGPAFQKASHSELVAVMRRDTAKAKDFAQRHGVANWYDSVEDLLNHPGINAVYIATPPSTHLQYSLQAIQAGKHVYLEKPMTLNALEAEVLLNATKGDVKITIAHYRRLLPAFLKVKDLLEQRAIGDVRFVDLQVLHAASSKVIAKTKVNWRINPAVSGGGYFHDLAPHHIDLMCHFFGPVKQAYGFCGNLGKHTAVDDLVSGIIKFNSGVQFQGVWCFSLKKENQKELCTIYGSQGSISFGFFGNEILINTGVAEVLRFDAEAHVQRPMIDKTIDYFLGKGENPCSVKEAKDVMEVMDIFTSSS